MDILLCYANFNTILKQSLLKALLMYTFTTSNAFFLAIKFNI